MVSKYYCIVVDMQVYNFQSIGGKMHMPRNAVEYDCNILGVEFPNPAIFQGITTQESRENHKRRTNAFTLAAKRPYGNAS